MIDLMKFMFKCEKSKLIHQLKVYCISIAANIVYENNPWTRSKIS